MEECSAQVLNADFRPLSYFPLSLWSWHDAVKAVVTDRVNVVSSYDRYVRSPSFALRAPSVIALKDFIVPNRKPAFTRFNVFLRDRFACQYCGDALPSHELTFDHVVPRFSCRKMSAVSRLIFCMIAGGTFCTGIRNSIRSKTVPTAKLRRATQFL